MPLAVFHELVWLDLFPAGTYIPPNGVLSLLLGLLLARQFGLTTPPEMVVPLLLTLPAALCGAHVEYLLRRGENLHYNKMLHWGRQPIASSLLLVRIVRRSVYTHALAQALLFLGWAFVLYITISALSAYMGYIPRVKGITWEYIWFAGAVGGVLALRIGRAYLVYGGSLIAGAIASVFG